MSTTGWLTGLRVTADGTGIVSHAGVALVRALADNIGRLGPHQRPATGPLTRTKPSQRPKKEHSGPVEPRPPGPPAGPLITPKLRNKAHKQLTGPRPPHVGPDVNHRG